MLRVGKLSARFKVFRVIMKKELLLLRHGKSDWNIGCSDFDRPLKKRGVDETQNLGLWMQQQKIIPDLIISSPAKRAIDTAQTLCKTLELAIKNIYIESDIYSATSCDLKRIICNVPEQTQRVLIVGHNPSMDSLLIDLVEGQIKRPNDGKLFATATLAHLKLNSCFSKLKNNSAVLQSLTRGSFKK